MSLTRPVTFHCGRQIRQVDSRTLGRLSGPICGIPACPEEDLGTATDWKRWFRTGGPTHKTGRRRLRWASASQSSALQPAGSERLALLPSESLKPFWTSRRANLPIVQAMLTMGNSRDWRKNT